MTENFAVLRFAKIRNLGGLSSCSKHNMREAEQGIEHADPERRVDNQLLQGEADALQAWKKRTEDVGLGKTRRDAVRAVEMVMSASPEWFASASTDDRDEWVRRSMAYANKVVGKENVLQAVLHLDEETPHIHVLAVPLIEKTRKKAGRPRKGRAPTDQTAGPTWGLSADEVVGGKSRLVQHQNDYALSLTELGIRRGVPKRITNAQHKSAVRNRIEAAEDRQDAHNLLDAAEVIRADAVKRAGVMKGKALHQAEKQASALTLGFNAIDSGELVYNPNIKNPVTPKMERVEIETPILPQQKTTELGDWLISAKPLWSALVSYAKRLSSLKARELACEKKERQIAEQAQELAEIARRQTMRELAHGKEIAAQQDQARLRDLRAPSRDTLEWSEHPTSPPSSRSRGIERSR